MAKLNKEDLLKAVEEMSVLELADFVKALEEKFGVSAAPMAMAAAPAAGVQLLTFPLSPFPSPPRWQMAESSATPAAGALANAARAGRDAWSIW